MDAPTGDSFLVMTHNAGNGHARPPKLARVLRDSEADIIGLQEITTAQAEELDAELHDVYPYRVLYGEGIPGKGILSKFPILEARQLHIFPNRPDLWGQLDVGGRSLDLVSGHPWPPRAHRDGYYQGPETREHIRRLLELAGSGRPAIVVGDFNFTERNKAYTEFAAAGLTDAFRVAGKGRGGTLPVHVSGIPLSPVLRVDYILHTKHFKAEEAWVGTSTGSDHRPVLARFCWVQ
ncbi:MAG: endonuclease/exonuclease/phosphatase family protein [Chloroflexia bacterium]